MFLDSPAFRAGFRMAEKPVGNSPRPISSTAIHASCLLSVLPSDSGTVLHVGCSIPRHPVAGAKRSEDSILELFGSRFRTQRDAVNIAVLYAPTRAKNRRTPDSHGRCRSSLPNDRKAIPRRKLRALGNRRVSLARLSRNTVLDHHLVNSGASHDHNRHWPTESRGGRKRVPLSARFPWHSVLGSS